jgi:hypothetical protein
MHASSRNAQFAGFLMVQSPKKPGRPPKPQADKVVQLTTSLPPHLREKYTRLGGGAWLVKALAEAKEPPGSTNGLPDVLSE